MSESPRRRQLLDAAQAVIADSGLKGLTHRAVDRRAGLPEGSCSAYLRTRHALQAALAEHVAGQLLADVDELAEGLLNSPEPDSVDAALGLLQRWLDQRELLVARLELTMAATRDPGLAEVLAIHRARLVSIVEGLLTAHGKGQGATRAAALVASYDGLLITALLRPEAERHDFLAESLELLGSALVGPPAE